MVVVLVYVAAAVAALWMVIQTWRSASAGAAATAFIALGLLMALAQLSFALSLGGFDLAHYPYVVASCFLPFAASGVLDGLFGASDDLITTRHLRRTALFASAIFLVIEPNIEEVSKASAPEVLVSIVTFAAMLVPLVRLARTLRREQLPIEADQLRVVFWLMLATLVSNGLEQLLRAYVELRPADLRDRGFELYAWTLQGDAPPLGAITGVAWLFVLGRVVNRELDVREVVARASALLASALLLAAAQSALVQIAGSEDTIWTHSSFLLFLSGLGYLALYPPLRRALDSRAAQWFNRPGWRLDQALNEVDLALGKALSLESLDRALLEPLHLSGRASLVTLYLWSQEQGLYRLIRQRGQPSRPLMLTIGAHPFTDGFQQGGRAYYREELIRPAARRIGSHDAADRLRFMDAMQADLSLPLRAGGMVLGWLNLQVDETAEGFAPDELRRLQGTMDRAAVALENIASVAALEEQRRLAALGTMAAGLAHEIRNPLAGIKGAAQYLQGREASEELRDFLDVIVDEVNRLNDVVSQFLDYARPLRLDREPTEPAELIQNAVDLVRAEGLPAELRLELELPTDLPAVPLDRHKIRQILLNLLRNATQAVGSAGTVRVSAQLGPHRGPGGRPQPALLVSISDTGSGIAPEEMEKLFIPFFTTKQGGTGLGLAISRRLAAAHGGDITVSSAPREGATFTLRIPMEPPAP